MAAGRKHFGGSLAGRLVLTAGLGGMGGAQPLAGVLAGAAMLVVEVDPERVERRLREGYLQHRSDDLESALALVLGAKERGRGDLRRARRQHRRRAWTRLLERGITPDIVTDQTTTDPIRGYVPRGMTAAECDELRARDRDELIRRADATLVDHIRAMLEFQRRGAEVFEYGNGLRARAQTARRRGRLRHGRVHGALHPAALLPGHRPVPLARDLGQPAGHLRGRRPHPRALRGRSDHALDQRGARGRAVHGPAGAHRLARLRRPAQARPARQRRGRERPHLGPDRVHARPSRLGLGGRARCARRSACATAPTASPTGRS